MTLQVITPSDPGYVTDYAVCLPLAETIGRSALFASDHDADRSQEAFCEWLTAWGLDATATAPEQDIVWRVSRYVQVTAQADLHITMSAEQAAATDSWDAFHRARNLVGSYGTNHATRSAGRVLNREWSRVNVTDSGQCGYASSTAIRDSAGRVIGWRYLVQDIASGSSAATVHGGEQDTAPDRADWTPEHYGVGRVLDRVASFRPVAWQEALQRYLSFRAPSGYTYRVERPTLAVSDQSDAVDDTPSGHDAIAAAVAELWEEQGAAGIASTFGIRTTDAISTDMWLRMVRDTAQEYEWCSAHHALVTRVTHATREPFGEYVSGSWSGTVTITVQVSGGSDENIRTDFNGEPEGVDYPEIDEWSVARSVERMFRDYGVDPDSVDIEQDVDSAGTESGDSYEPPATRTMQWRPEATAMAVQGLLDGRHAMAEE
jgi:hypothetical protein